jgi:hypothetical protein
LDTLATKHELATLPASVGIVPTFLGNGIQVPAPFPENADKALQFLHGEVNSHPTGIG